MSSSLAKKKKNSTNNRRNGRNEADTYVMRIEDGLPQHDKVLDTLRQNEVARPFHTINVIAMKLRQEEVKRTNKSEGKEGKQDGKGESREWSV